MLILTKQHTLVLHKNNLKTMIRTTIKLLCLCFSVGLVTTACSNDDSFVGPVKPPIVEPEKAKIYDLSNTVVAKQISFVDNATTELGTTVSKEWEPTISYLKPVSLALGKEKLTVTYLEDRKQEYTVKVTNNDIVIESKDHPTYTFATLSADKKSLTINSSFFRIKGAHKTLNVNNSASLQEYGVVDLTTFKNKYNHLKNTSGKYLQITFEYKLKN